MANNISVLSHDECTGCRACGDACPKQCIHFYKDDEGFFYPKVDEDICISCGKCENICPAIHPSFNEPSDVCYAAYATNPKDKRSGSSGGIFGVLAADVIEKGGSVWGAAFDQNLQLHHNCATTLEQLEPLKRSKYIQSNTTGCYSEILNGLKDGKLTLFTGTPCQINALLNFIPKGLLGSLITVEIVCHGVPSQDLFDKTIMWEEKTNNSKVTKFTFRAKPVGAKHPQAYSIEYTCGTKSRIKNGLHYQWPYYFGFQKYLTLRPACYICKWAKPQRRADITLADFWGIENYEPQLNAKDGVSAIVINTPNGQEYITRLQENGAIWMKALPIDYLIANNGCMSAPTQLKPTRELFFHSLKEDSFDIVVKKYLTPNRKWIFDLYYSIPNPLRKIVRKLMDKRMRYE